MPDRTVAVIQARTGSTRLPGKVFELLGGLPLYAWTVLAMTAIDGVDDVVLATTLEAGDDRLVDDAQTRFGIRIHRGSTDDVLRRIWDAVAPLEPDLVLRQTADNPFCDPGLMAAQRQRLLDTGADYVGHAGLPLGIGAEVARATALEVAEREAASPAEREHVMPFVYGHPDRFRIEALPDPPPFGHHRYTVDTAADLAFARAVAERLGHGPTVRLEELERVLAADPELGRMNATERQKAAQEAG
jgi:spore coat polysaccharide biosynthesis protein SpsF (cytidylyltransferase family)